jgi:hypothetical protein
VASRRGVVRGRDPEIVARVRVGLRAVLEQKLYDF